MDFGYLVCSTLRCETVVDDTHPPSAVESSCSEGSFNSDQTSSTLDGKSSVRDRKLQSGYTSPSSLALQRRPPEAPFYLKQQTLSTDSTTSTDSSSSKRKSSTMRNNNPRRGAAEFESRSGKFRIIARPEVDDDSARFETTPEKEVLPVDDFQQFRLNPPPLRSKAFAEPSAENYHVRSKGYMTNRIKEPSKKSAFQLITVDLINTETPLLTGMCAKPGERIQLALERERKTGIRELPEFVFAVNLCIPGDKIYHAVFYYGIDKPTLDEIKTGRTAFGRMMKKFLFGDSDDFRNETFKLIPRIVEGNYLVRKGVGSKPAIMGKKIKQCYVRGDRYFEVIVDIASDPVAKQITKLCLGYIRTIVVDMMFALEGYDESTLPERIFGGVTIKNLDFVKLDGKRCVR